jgi:dTDP-glucose 4,6-dehydratase
VGSECRGFLLISSGAVYGPNSTGRSAFAESEAGGPDPALAKNAYAEGKRAAEMMSAISALRGAPTRIARCFAFVGPHMPFDRHFAIGNFIADAVAGREIRVRSDGRPLRSYLYMTDLVRALLVILNRGAEGAAYNVGSDIPISIEQLAHTVNRVVGGTGVSIGGAPSSWTEHYVPNTERLRSELNFRPIVDLEAAIYRTAAWYRAQGVHSLP